MVPFVVWQLSRGDGEQENTLAACLEQPSSPDGDAAPSADPDAAQATDPDKAAGPCALRRAPETYTDLADASNAVAQPNAAWETTVFFMVSSLRK